MTALDDEPIHHHPIGYGPAHSRVEHVGLYLWLAAMIAFLYWLIRYGVNV